MRIEDTPDCEVIINNVNVTYSQYLPTMLLEETTWDDDSVITIHSENTVLTMNDVVVTTELHCLCHDSWSTDDFLILITSTGLPYCNSPTPFLINQECLHF